MIATDHLQALCDPEIKQKTPYPIRLDGSDAVAATDGRGMLAVLGGSAAGLERVDLSGKSEGLLALTTRTEPIHVALSAVKQWAGTYEPVTEVTCGRCFGDGRTICSECESEIDCPQCEKGKERIYPKARYGRIVGCFINRNLVAKFLSPFDGDEQVMLSRVTVKQNDHALRIDAHDWIVLAMESHEDQLLADELGECVEFETVAAK